MKMPKGLHDISNFKYPDEYELAVPLTDACNMKCDFCFENQHLKTCKPLTVKDVEEAIQPVLDNLKKDLAVNNYKQINMKLWGGELLHDGVSDEVFNSYKTFANAIKRNVPIPVSIVFLSNGIYTNLERIEKLLREMGAYISYSYDPVGRFKTDKQWEVFKKGFDYFYSRNLMCLVSITLSKPSIQEYITKHNFLLDLPRTIDINFNYYLPNANWKENLPTAEDYYKFFKWAIANNLFNIDLINSMMASQIPEYQNSREKLCNCKASTQYIGYRKICHPSCVERVAGDYFDFKEYFYGKYYDELTDENEFSIRSSLARYKTGCLTCEHFNFCPMPCPVSVIFTPYKADFCPIKRVYDELTEDDKARYKEWRTNSPTNYIVKAFPLKDEV